MEDITTSAMIGALEKFFGRRGLPKSIDSDQGKQIVAANKEIQDVWLNLHKRKIDENLITKGIQWTFTNVY